MVTPPPHSDHTHHTTPTDTLGDFKPTEEVRTDHSSENLAEPEKEIHPGSHDDASNRNGHPTNIEYPTQSQRVERPTVSDPNMDQRSNHPPVPESVSHDVPQVERPPSEGGDTHDHSSGTDHEHDVSSRDEHLPPITGSPGDSGVDQVKQKTVTRSDSVSGGENFESQQFLGDTGNPSTLASDKSDPTPLVPPQATQAEVVHDEKVHHEPDTFLTPSQTQVLVKTVTKVEYQPPQHTPTATELPPSYQTEPPSSLPPRQDFESDPLTPTPNTEAVSMEEGEASQDQLEVEGNLKQDQHSTGNYSRGVADEPSSTSARDDLPPDQIGQRPPDHSNDGQDHNRKIFTEEDDERYWDSVDEDEWSPPSEKREHQNINIGEDKAATHETGYVDDPQISPEVTPSLDRQGEQTHDLDISQDTSEHIMTPTEPTVASSQSQGGGASMDTPHATPRPDESPTHTEGTDSDEYSGTVPTETPRDFLQAQEHARKSEDGTFMDQDEEEEEEEEEEEDGGDGGDDGDDGDDDGDDDGESERDVDRSKSVEEMRRVYEEQKELNRQQQQILLQQQLEQQQRQQQQEQQQQQQQRVQQQQKEEQQHQQEQQQEEQRQQEQQQEEQQRRQEQQQQQDERRQDKEEVLDTLPDTQEKELYTHPPQTGQPPSLESSVTPAMYQEPAHNEGGYKQSDQEVLSTPPEEEDRQEEYKQRPPSPDGEPPQPREDDSTPPPPVQPYEETVTMSYCDCPQDIAPPPSCVGVGGYLPLPGSDTGVLWYVERYRVYVRDVVFATFPEAWSEWVIENVSLNISSLVAGTGSIIEGAHIWDQDGSFLISWVN